jgi:hypothetical protein
MEECIICFEEQTDFVTFLCGHKVCKVCFPKLSLCPLCNREFVQTYIPITHQVHVTPHRNQNNCVLQIICFFIIIISIYVFALLQIK